MSEMSIPLRWTRKQAKHLIQVAKAFESEGAAHEDISLWVAAAKAADDLDSLVVECSTREELDEIVEGFARWGVRPTVG